MIGGVTHGGITVLAGTNQKLVASTLFYTNHWCQNEWNKHSGFNTNGRPNINGSLMLKIPGLQVVYNHKMVCSYVQLNR